MSAWIFYVIHCGMHFHNVRPTITVLVLMVHYSSPHERLSQVAEYHIFDQISWYIILPTLSICSFSAANRDTEPNTSLNSFRYRLDLSILAETIKTQKPFILTMQISHYKWVWKLVICISFVSNKRKQYVFVYTYYYFFLNIVTAVGTCHFTHKAFLSMTQLFVPQSTYVWKRSLG